MISFTECTLGVVASPLQNDQLVCHVSNRCTNIDCCLYDTETFRHYKLFLHIDPCDYRLQIGIELYSFDVSLLDFDFGKNNYSAVWCYHAPKGSVVNFTAHQNFIEFIYISSSNTVKYYFYGPYPDSATIFDISVKMKCKQTNHRFLTNVATFDDIAHADFGWFLK